MEKVSNKNLFIGSIILFFVGTVIYINHRKKKQPISNVRQIQSKNVTQSDLKAGLVTTLGDKFTNGDVFTTGDMFTNG